MSTFICRLDAEAGSGPRLAVKDLIDMAGLPTTAGSRAVARRAAPAAEDAPCLAGARAGGARIVGKANLHELAFGGTGLNPWFGNPVNPLDPARIPGGSSSGSAVAVATGEADVAFGSDTGGSVRTPSACCGTVGLKTTHGRISLAGVWPLAPSLDTVGPMARDIAGVTLGMELLEPGFAVSTDPVHTVGRFRGVDADPLIDGAIDRALAESEVDVVEITLPGWQEAVSAGIALIVSEGWASDGGLWTEYGDELGADVRERLGMAHAIPADAVAAAHATRERWRAELADVFTRVQAIALPTLIMFAPPLDDDGNRTVVANIAVNLAGHPALALPVPAAGPLPASLQLIGPDGGEESLLAVGAVMEGAARSLGS